MGEYHSPLPNDTKMKKLSNILKNLAYSEIIGNENIEISGVQFDSRKVTKGDLFIATRGTNVDGHDYIQKAVEQGAVAVVVEAPPSPKPPLTPPEGENFAELQDSKDCDNSTVAKASPLGRLGEAGRLTANVANYGLLKEFAQNMRKFSTEAESALWEMLRRKNLDVRFRRQHIIGDFIVDFVCLKEKLIIEVDGGYHNEPNVTEYDKIRTQILNDLGFNVIRFTNEEVLADADNVQERIKIALSQTSPLPGGLGGAVIVVPDTAEALGIIACNFYDNPSQKLKLVGVTGTNGKTTVATLLYELFRKLGYKTGLLSTVTNFIDDREVVATHTTPDALALNRLLAEMVDAGCEYAFMEVSSHAVAQRRVAGIQFAGGIFTNLTQDHLDYHGTMENYLKAKKRFFDELPATAFMITNLDDKNGKVMQQNTRAKKYNYTLRAMGDFKTRVLEHDFSGMLLSMNGHEVHVPFVGRFNASNLSAVFGTAMLLLNGRDAMPCVSTARHDHTPTEIEILTAISTLHSVSGRFETLHAPGGYTAIVDYAHTPDALKNVIGTINQVLQDKEGRLITVVGCGGERDKTKRPLMAQEAVNGSWKAILTSDNPRSENPQDILNDMLAGLDNEERKKTLVIENRREAIRTACTLAQAGDVVLVAGKGHENYQDIKGVKHHFDDREEVKAMF